MGHGISLFHQLYHVYCIVTVISVSGYISITFNLLDYMYFCKTSKLIISCSIVVPVERLKGESLVNDVCGLWPAGSTFGASSMHVVTIE